MKHRQLTNKTAEDEKDLSGISAHGAHRNPDDSTMDEYRGTPGMIDGGAIGKAERVAFCILLGISLPLTVSATAYFLCAADLPAAASSILEGMVIGLALADAMCAAVILDTVGRTLLKKGNQT